MSKLGSRNSGQKAIMEGIVRRHCTSTLNVKNAVKQDFKTCEI